ncbi:MAG: PIN domain-containing protein [Chloroflexota bacterium]|nr:PIN domain-containing protein [Chloroflexota bacterium]
MNRVIVLDTGVLGIATNPNATAEAEAVRRWLEGLTDQGDTIVIPDIADYELRRKYIRNHNLKGLRKLKLPILKTNYISLSTPIMRTAAQLWAQTRQQGKLTADDEVLDGDVILAAQVYHLDVEEDVSVVVATTNVKHLEWFVDARKWSEI